LFGLRQRMLRPFLMLATMSARDRGEVRVPKWECAEAGNP
jgi:hypothetical protein